MKEMEIDEDILLDLLNIIKKTVNIEREKGNIQLETNIVQKFEVSNFGYTDRGCTSLSGSYVDMLDESWSESIDKVYNIVCLTKEYALVSDHLYSLFNQREPFNGLSSFIKRLIIENISDNGNLNIINNRLLHDYVNELKGGPIKQTAKVYLQGIIMGIDQIQINSQLLLRRPKKEDFESMVLAGHPQSTFIDLSCISAFLIVHVFDRNFRVLQNEIEKALILLRLFRVGGVREISYKIETESFLPRMDGVFTSSTNKEKAFHNYKLTEEDNELLFDFCKVMHPLVSSHFSKNQKEDAIHISISYQHFSDSLIPQSSIEHRIASAIMGLEALFLKTDERSELNYRLAFRIAKFMSKIQKDPIFVKDSVKDSYYIRSVFLHGDKLSKTKKYEDRYGGTKNLLLTILGYLRLSLLLFLSIDAKKPNLIDLIDNSLISADADHQLAKIIEQCTILNMQKFYHQYF